MARIAKSVSLREEVIEAIQLLAKEHDRSFSYEIDFAADRWVRHCKEMNDEHTKPDDNSRAEPRAREPDAS